MSNPQKVETGAKDAPWMVGTEFDSPTSLPQVVENEDAARRWLARAEEATAGNVRTWAVPLSVVLAAPDLLEAAKEYAARLEADGFGNSKEFPISHGRLVKVRAAIAKAEGVR